MVSRIDRRLILSLIAAGLLGSTFFGSSASAAGTAWQPLTLDQALAQARQEDKLVMIDVWSEHCGQCGQMDIDLWDLPQGATFTQDLIPLKFNNSTADGIDLMQRYPVTGLPTILFLNGDGTEVDRVQGYTTVQQFLSEAMPIARGVDQLPVVEAQLKANPTSLPLLNELLEKYLFRSRDADAKALLDKILSLDDGTKSQAERAVTAMARYQSNYRNDHAAAFETYKLTPERYPNSSSVGGAIDGAYREALSAGKVDAWKQWLCDLSKRHATVAGLQYSVAGNALRNGARGRCLGDAARLAKKLGYQVRRQSATYLDSIATVLDGAPGSTPR